MLTEADKVGVYVYTPDSYQMDFRGRITLPTIGNYLLHVASRHAGDRGFGYSEMTEQHTAWVLSRLAIEMLEYPVMEEPLSIFTWVDEVNKLFTSRCFEWQDASGKTLGYARSIWAAIDMQTRKPTLLNVGQLSEYISSRPCLIDKPGKIPAAEIGSSGEAYVVKYSDLDINGHLNSIKYIEHLLDTFDLSMFQQKEIQRFEIAYQAEGRYGMELKFHNKPLEDTRYILSICHEEKPLCRASVTWR